MSTIRIESFRPESVFAVRTVLLFILLGLSNGVAPPTAWADDDDDEDDPNSNCVCDCLVDGGDDDNKRWGKTKLFKPDAGKQVHHPQ